MNGSRGYSSGRERKSFSRSRKGEAIAGEAKDFKISEDVTAKLREFNEHLVEEIKRSREEEASLSVIYMEIKRVLLQCRAEKIELESELNEFKVRTKKLLEKTEEDRHLWVAEERNLKGILAEMQTNLGMMVCERGFLMQKNRDLSTEMECLNSQLNECNAKLACMEDEREQNERALHQCRTEKIDLESELNESKRRSQELLGKFEGGYFIWKVISGCLWHWPKLMLKLVIIRPFQTVRRMILLPFSLVSLTLKTCISLFYSSSRRPVMLIP